jgi:hypothetical protein
MTDELNDFELMKLEARDYYKDFSLQYLVTRMRDLQLKKAEQEAALKQTNAWLDVLRFEMIPAKMDEEGIERVSYEGIGRVSLTADLLVSTRAGMKDDLFHWLNDHGLGDIVQPTVNASTLKAFVKERMRNNKEYPEELLNVTPITRASITKG